MIFEKFEALVKQGLENKKQKKMILIATLVAFVLSVLMIAPTEIVKAKMLPGKNNDTFTIYVNLPEGASIEQTRAVSQCVTGYVQKEQEVEDHPSTSYEDNGLTAGTSYDYRVRAVA